VMMDEPKQGYYGGQTAAPVFRQIAERTASYLGIRPEREEEFSVPQVDEETRITKTDRNP